MLRRLTQLILIVALAMAGPPTDPVSKFGTAEEARDALIRAAGTSLDSVRDVLGAGSHEILRSGDPVEDRNLLDRFNQRAKEKVQLRPDPMNPNRVVVLVGEEEWPFAVPLKRVNGKWSFDLEEGKTEIRHRIIGANELDAMQVCRGYVEAQELYAQTDWQGKGVAQYASRLVSTAGKKDGLYWPGEDSPVAAAIAKAASEGYGAPGTVPKPYHGYYYKMLPAQGAAARGGARDYIIRGLMIGGFALVAWPAEYGVSGITTFIVNQDGVVYEKDLGPSTRRLAEAMTTFNPDSSWQEAPEF
jgi:hypothetical protein